jgi:membrane protease YdiL (CAAX protease family)
LRLCARRGLIDALNSPPGLPLILYFGLVFIVTWPLWFAANGVSAPPIRLIIFLTGTFAPGIVALLLTYRERGSAGVRTLLKRLVKIDVSGRWLVFALFFMIVVKLLVALIARVSTGAWPDNRVDLLPLMVAGAIISTLTGGQVGEELGWRGYALPRIARSLGPGPASVLVGIIWAVWHLPLFFILGGDTLGQSFPFYLLQVTALSIAIGWIYMKSDGSLFVTMLLHAAVNNTKDVVPSVVPGATNPWQLHASLVGWLTLGILWTCATWFLYDMRRDVRVRRFAEVQA